MSPFCQQHQSLHSKPCEYQDSKSVSFVCYCKPQPQGSSRAFIPKGWSRPVITSANPKLKSYRQELASSALQARGSSDVLFAEHEPVEIAIAFFLERPKSVPKKREMPTVKPDLDKLVRAVKDSLKGIMYHDDGQVVWLTARKFYGSPERTEISLSNSLTSPSSSAATKRGSGT